MIKQIKDKLRAEYKELVSAGRKMSNIPVNVSAETSSKELVKTAYELEKAIKAFGESVKGPEHMKEMLKVTIQNEISKLEKEKKAAIDKLDKDMLDELDVLKHGTKSKIEELQRKKEEMIKKKDEEFTDNLNKLKELFRLIETAIVNKNDLYVKTEDMSFNYMEMSVDDLTSIVDVVEESVNKYNKMSKISNLFILLWVPLEVRLSKKIEEISYIVNVLLLLLFLVMGKSTFLGILGFIQVTCILSKLIYTSMNREIFSYALTLYRDRETVLKTFDMKIKASDDIRGISSELLELEEFQDDTEAMEVINKFKKLKDEMSSDEEFSKKIELLKSIEFSDIIDETFTREYDRIVDMNEDSKLSLQEDLDRVEREIFDRADNFKTLGTYINQSVRLQPKIEDKYVEYKGRVVGSDSFTVPITPVFFDEDSLCKLYMLNFLSNVRQTKMVLTIIDPLYSGRDYAELYMDSLEKYIKIETRDLTTVLPEYKKNVEENIKKIGALTIDDYNDVSSETGRESLQYNLVVVVSDKNPNKLQENNELQSFIKIAHEYGYIFWFARGMEDFVKGLSKVTKAEKPKTSEYSMELADKVKYVLDEFIQNGVQESVPYKDYAAMVVKEEWEATTLDNVDVEIGYPNGDLRKSIKLKIGDSGNVHMLIGGDTGMGKSNALNTLLLTLFKKYSAKWLEVWFIDYKITTAAMYSGTNLPPQMKVLSGTRDGEYADSIFDEAVKEMTRRLALFGKYKYQKISDFNKAVLRGDIKDEEIIPRIFIVFDEYQAMFKDVSDKIKESVTIRISKLASEARSAGIHMVFCSQGVEGGMPESVRNQFKMRVALPCKADVSKSIIGNTAAEKYTTYGWCVMNNSYGDVSKNVHIRVPYLADDVLNRELPRLKAKGISEGLSPHKTAFFQEEDLCTKESIDKQIARFPALNNGSIVVLGERLNYSPKNEPIIMNIRQEDGNNIIVSGSNTVRCAKIVKNIMDNLSKKNPTALNIVCGMDKDFEDMLVLSDYKIVNKFRHNSDLPELIKSLAGEIQLRTETKDKRVPIFVYLLGIHKNLDYQEENYKVTDLSKFVAIQGPAVGVHLIGYSREPLPMRWLKRSADHIIMTVSDENLSNSVIESSTAAKLNGESAVYKFQLRIESKFKLVQSAIKEPYDIMRDVFKEGA